MDGKVRDLSPAEANTFQDNCMQLLSFLHNRADDPEIKGACGVAVHASLRFIANIIAMGDDPVQVATNIMNDFESHLNDAALDRAAQAAAAKSSAGDGPMLSTENPEFTQEQVTAIGSMMSDTLKQADMDGVGVTAMRFKVLDNHDGTFTAKLLETTNETTTPTHH